MKLPDIGTMRSDLARLLAAAGEPVEAAAVESIARHIALLAKWNARYHLTAIRTWDAVLDRHVAESLIPLRWIGPMGRLLDIGTGNGYPSLPILACRPLIEAVLVERSEKKCLFLEAALREMRRSRVRIETRDIAAHASEEDDLGLHDVVISRATLSPERYLAIAASSVCPGGRVLLYAGSDAEPVCLDRELHGLTLADRTPILGRRDSFVYLLTR